MANTFPEVNGCFGFGFMRLPMMGEDNKEIDIQQTCDMVDAYLSYGFNYFDVAHGYLSERCEGALKAALTSRYPRESYILTNKLSDSYFNEEADIRPLLERQLELCGVDYFDFYLLHAQDKDIYDKYKRCRAYEVACELKAEGKVRHVGFSFHDKADFLDVILTEHPEMEVVQLQINYLDYESEAVQSRKCLEVCQRHGKPVIVMEPVKGGVLANVPDEAREVFARLSDATPASYALRFAASCEGVYMTLSGMSNMEQLHDNCTHMANFRPIDAAEQAAIDEATAIFNSKNLIPCTACRYCVLGCPMEIEIPALFSCYNNKEAFGGWNPTYYYSLSIYDKGMARDCIECGACESICPQHLEIRDLLKTVGERFTKQEDEEEARRTNE